MMKTKIPVTITLLLMCIAALAQTPATTKKYQAKAPKTQPIGK